MCVYIVQCVIYPWYPAFSAEAQRPWSSFQPFVSLRGCLANGLQSWENSGRVTGVMYLWDTLWDSHLGWFNGDKWWFNGDKWWFYGDKWWFNGDKWWFYGGEWWLTSGKHVQKTHWKILVPPFFWWGIISYFYGHFQEFLVCLYTRG